MIGLLRKLYKNCSLERIRNFTSAVGLHASNGLPAVTEAQYAERLEICRGCEWFDAKYTACNECGCFLKTKARWADMDCGAGKWPRIELAVVAADPPSQDTANKTPPKRRWCCN